MLCINATLHKNRTDDNEIHFPDHQSLKAKLFLSLLYSSAISKIKSPHQRIKQSPLSVPQAEPYSSTYFTHRYSNYINVGNQKKCLKKKLSEKKTDGII